ncbi:MAG: MBL fold metallo-hydrolase [Candidatus Binatus sp.]|uniref:MBL fold metallo-hydrolase n=1 Tax=Candidatus Binatus sp. TaxID=2811406 RepID=UPI00271BCD3C|nr:MBL fold metallo-hydrolase [Candidatus Binatus sp.]MDO8434799.1 MBL fold metallo-hydrolase [Candidatus Binatus sp.]
MFREINFQKCKTYLGWSDTSDQAALIDPVRDKIERYLALLAYRGLKLGLIVDTHTHADHRSGAFELGELTGAPVAMHRRAPAPHVKIHVEDGQMLTVGDLAMRVLYTPGHTPDSISLHAGDRVFTGDVLLIHGTGRCDFAGGDPAASFDSIMSKLFTLPDSTIVLPAHDYRGHTQSTIGEEKRSNPRLAGKSREAYVDLMNKLGLPLPDGIQEALQPNQSDVDSAALAFPNLSQLNSVRQMNPQELYERIKAGDSPILIDVREPGEYRGELGHLAGSQLIPLRELTERASELTAMKDREIVTVCRVGLRSATAAAILTSLGCEHVLNLKGGMLEWNDAGLPVEK